MITYASGGRTDQAAVVTVGSFDGVHLGHRALVERAARVARARGLASIVLTFHPHPSHVLGGVVKAQLTASDERNALLLAAGADDVAIMHFDRSVAALSPEVFVRDVLVGQLRASAVVMGHDHRFGHGRKGDAASMASLGLKYGYEIHEVSAVHDGQGAVSSSRIRRALTAGRVEDAARMLGRAFSLTGTVVRGDGRGSRIGFPTANLDLDRRHAVRPARGVYAAWASVDGAPPRKSMVNIGVRPTFGGTEEHAEVHLLETDADLYGCEVRAEFVVRLRDEHKFDGVQALIRQLNEDRLRCRAALR